MISKRLSLGVVKSWDCLVKGEGVKPLPDEKS